VEIIDLYVSQCGVYYIIFYFLIFSFNGWMERPASHFWRMTLESLRCDVRHTSYRYIIIRIGSNQQYPYCLDGVQINNQQVVDGPLAWMRCSCYAACICLNGLMVCNSIHHLLAMFQKQKNTT